MGGRSYPNDSRKIDTRDTLRDTLKHPMRLAFALLAVLLFAGPAHAALHVCNKTARPVKLALGRFDGAVWSSTGWWALAPRQCAELVPGKLIARYYYLYATDGGSGGWTGSRGFCVSNDGKFAIPGREACEGRGFERKGFFEVDTGEAQDYTQSISD
jgi:uncharacterized membrane protein